MTAAEIRHEQEARWEATAEARQEAGETRTRNTWLNKIKLPKFLSGLSNAKQEFTAQRKKAAFLQLHAEKIKYDEWYANPFDTTHGQIFRHKLKDKDIFFAMSTGNYEHGTSAIGVYPDAASIMKDEYGNHTKFALPDSRDNMGIAHDLVKKTISFLDNNRTTEIKDIEKYLEFQTQDLQDKKELETNIKKEEFIYARSQTDKIKECLKNSTLCCLPGADGRIDTVPPVNLETGEVYLGANLFSLKARQKELGFPTAEYLTRDQIDKANRYNPNITIKEGETGIKLQVLEWDKREQVWENKKVELYNVAQTTDPEKLKDWELCHAFQTTDPDKVKDWDSYIESKVKRPGPLITCSSTEPEKYLGQYFAAVSTGGTFKASPEQAKEFSAKLENSLNKKMDNDSINPFNFRKITNAAGVECEKVIWEERKLNQEPKLERQQQRGRSR